MKSRPALGGLVYSTDLGRTCPACRQAIAQCSCAALAAPSTLSTPSDGIVRVSRETKGRGGKTVTLVRGLATDPASLEKVAKQLKAACGCGGAVKDGVVEIQGEHRDKVLAFLQARGHKVKRAGG